MAKYDWSSLEKEYILGNYKSVSSFLKEKNIPNNGSSRKQTNGWNDKRRQKQDKNKTRTIEKVIEKESEKEANKIINIKDTASILLEKLNQSMDELNKYFSVNKTKTKSVKYDYKVGKPKEEIINEEEHISEYSSIIDRSGLKQLTSALKDLNEVLNNDKNNLNNSHLISEIEKAWSNRNDK